MYETECECEWYLLCENPTSEGIMLPILGLVPTCGRCAEKHGMTHDLVSL